MCLIWLYPLLAEEIKNLLMCLTLLGRAKISVQ